MKKASEAGKKCVFVFGPESSGSMLIAKICSHVLGVEEYGEWRGVGWSDKGSHKVYHRSQPYHAPPRYTDIDEWIVDNKKGYDLFFVLTTRDRTISELSRIERFAKSLKQVEMESEEAKKKMTQVIHSDQPLFIWSYETFMFLGKDYLKLLYEFLGLQSDFIPPIKDANKKRIVELGLADVPKTEAPAVISRFIRALRGRFN